VGDYKRRNGGRRLLLRKRNVGEIGKERVLGGGREDLQRSVVTMTAGQKLITYVYI